MEWRLVEFTKGRFLVSEGGDIKSVFREYKYKIVHCEKVRKPTYGGKKRRYLKFNFDWRENGARLTKSEFIHRLVAKAFVPLVDGKPHVNHKDGNKLNNHYTNLEWCTPQENNEHGMRMGLLKRGVTIRPYVSVRSEWSWYKPIIDINTGVFYKAEELAPLLGISVRYLLKMLRGERRNRFQQYRYA